MLAQDHLAAAFRHAEDAERLLDAGRTDNAAYLAGYVFECGLKVLVVESPYYTGDMPWIHDLRSLETLALAATLTEVDAEHRFPHVAIGIARKSGWAVSWRYVPDGTVSDVDALALVAAATTMRDSLSCAVLDGRIGA